MELILTKHQKNVATVLHASTFGKFIFPLANFILPLIFWTIYKKESDYIDHHGKEALNFQLSLFFYKVIVCVVSVPMMFFLNVEHFGFWDIFDMPTVHINFDNGFEIFGFTYATVIYGTILLILFAVNITYTIIASIKANEGIKYRYPFTIRVIK